MKRHMRVGFWLELALALATAFLAILTLVWDDWIEMVFGFDPDHHNGSFEWMLVLACWVVAAVAGYLARREWRNETRRVTPTTEPSPRS